MSDKEALLEEFNQATTPQDALRIAKKLVEGNPKAEKAFALAKNILGMSELMIDNFKLRYPKKKRIFRKRDRTTKRFQKQEKAKKLMVNSMQIQMQLMQHQMIKAQPLPKFPKGGNNEHRALELNGVAYLGETEKEIIKL